VLNGKSKIILSAAPIAFDAISELIEVNVSLHMVQI
jgi:hypothetical protein